MAKLQCKATLLHILVFCFAVSQCSAVHFYIKPGERRCFEEDLPVGSKITGIAQVASGPGDMEIDVWVTTLKGRVLYHRHGTEQGMISFMTPKSERVDLDDDDGDDEDTFRVCLEHQLRPSETLAQGARRLVSYRLDKALYKVGGFQSHATLRHANTLTERLREMHTTLSSMVGDLSFLEQRERRLLERNSLTSSRISILAGLSLIVMVATSYIQFTYYRQFFKAKKIC